MLCVGFEEGGRSHEPQKAVSLHELEKARKESLLEPGEGTEPADALISVHGNPFKTSDLQNYAIVSHNLLFSSFCSILWWEGYQGSMILTMTSSRCTGNHHEDRASLGPKM